jgi:hypothetical protein
MFLACNEAKIQTQNREKRSLRVWVAETTAKVLQGMNVGGYDSAPDDLL